MVIRRTLQQFGFAKLFFTNLLKIIINKYVSPKKYGSFGSKMALQK
jgi:hypothetical protein